MSNSPPSLLHLAARYIKLGLERGESFELERLPEEMIDVIGDIYPDHLHYHPDPWYVVPRVETNPTWFDIVFERRIGAGDLFVLKILNSRRVTRAMRRSDLIRERMGGLHRDAVRITRCLKFSRRGKIKISGPVVTRRADIFVFYCPVCDDSACEADFIDREPVGTACCYSRQQHKFEIEIEGSF